MGVCGVGGDIQGETGGAGGGVQHEDGFRGEGACRRTGAGRVLGGGYWSTHPRPWRYPSLYVTDVVTRELLLCTERALFLAGGIWVSEAGRDKWAQMPRRTHTPQQGQPPSC